MKRLHITLPKRWDRKNNGAYSDTVDFRIDTTFVISYSAQWRILQMKSKKQHEWVIKWEIGSKSRPYDDRSR